jgi:2-polyprenyl-6-methoxyphenol hydroxylase-like FAD-dependent oxidoreductase
VGAGGAGLSLSLLLHQHGIASVLVERRSDVSWYPRARNLNFRTLEVFRGLGLEPQVLAAGAHFSRTLRKETLASHEEEDLPSIEAFLHIADHLDIVTPEPALWYCPQSRLEPLMLAEAKRCGCDVRYDTELVSFTQDRTRVSATISDRATGTASVIEADYLLAADGAHSHVRKALGAKGEGLGVLDEHYIFIYFRAPWGELIRGYENDAILIDRPGIRGFFLITDADRGMFAIQEESAKDYTVERCKELIIDGIGKPDLAVEIVEIAHWQPGQLVAEHFGQGRVFLVGDAAHTMPPKLGLGVNTAIQSAQNLAWKLAAVLKGQASQELLSTYQAERRPVARLAAEQSLVGPAASLLTKAATTSCSLRRKGFRSSPSSLAIAIALAPFSRKALPRLREARGSSNSWRSQKRSPDSPGRASRICGSRGVGNASPRWICSMAASSCSPVLPVHPGKSQRPTHPLPSQSRLRPIGSTGISSMSRVAGARKWVYRLKAQCWCGRTALWRGA